MQQAQEAAAESEAQRLAHLGLETQRGIVELQLLQRVAQRVVLAGLGGVQTRKDLGLDLLEAWQGLRGRPGVVGQLLLQGDGVAHLRRLELLDAGDDKAHLAGLQFIARHRLGREHPDLLDAVHGIGGHHTDAVASPKQPVHHAHQHHHADVVVEPAVDDHGPGRAFGVALGPRHAGDHRFQDVVNAHAGLGRAGNGVGGIDADDLLHLLLGAIRVGLGQVHLIEHRHHFHAQVQRGVAVSHRLGLHTLAGIHHQQGALAGGERSADLVAEVHVSGRVDQVEVVDLAVTGLVAQGRGLGLDGDAALALDVHGVEHLGFHLPIGQPTAALDDAVSQRALAVIDVGNDREVADVVHRIG